jgi:CxxC motif-containing protein (DUF1111 family)
MSASSIVKCVAAFSVAGFCVAFVARAEERTTAKQSATVFVSTSTPTPEGKELFNREWIPNDPRAHGGDGLGPVFNESSCVSCHNQGGSGGGGVKNVDIITAFSNPVGQQQLVQQANIQPRQENLPGSILSAMVQSLTQPAAQPQPMPVAVNLQPAQCPAPQAANSAPEGETRQQLAKRQREELAKIHPGFLSARSVVLHRFSTDEKYEPWRLSMLGMGQQQLLLNADPLSSVPQAGEVINGSVTVFARADTNADPPAATPAAVDPPPAAAVQANTFRATAGSGTLVVTGTTTVTAAIQVQAQPAANAQGDFHISVVNESGHAEQQIQQLRTSAQMSNAQGLQGQVGNFAFVHSRRNATSLFGVGLIDKIPDSALIEQANAEHKDFPEIKGRVARLKDGKIGRFGWKDQKATLYDFAMTACAIELGLDVPDHPQAGLPLNVNYKPKAHDMDQAECDALVDYLRNLPAPARVQAASKQESEFIAAGEKQFAAVGCAACHTAKLGQVAGIYSDLLLHDMGPELGDSGSYGSFIPDTPDDDDQSEPIPSLMAQQANEPITNLTQLADVAATAAAARQSAKPDREKTIGALRQEWRTPPLWGVRDSAPYLHDGRAGTLEEAIAFHGGEGAGSAKSFFMLKSEQRMHLVAFLKSMTAPDQSASAE